MDLTNHQTADLLIEVIELIEQSSNRTLNGLCMYGNSGKVFSVLFADANNWEMATIEDGKVVIQKR